MNIKKIDTPCWIIVLILCLIVVFFVIGEIVVRNHSPQSGPGEAFFLKDEELVILKQRAIEDKDWVSAQLVSRYYSLYLQEPDEGDAWWKIAVGNRTNEAHLKNEATNGGKN